MVLLLLDNAPPPVGDPLTDKLGNINQPWVDWYNRMSQAVNAAPMVLNRVSLTTQGASISATDFSTGALNAGLYRLSYYARITRAATTSSSLTVTFGFTESSISLSVSTAALTGNTTSTWSGSATVVRVDAAAPVTYATTYASVGATSMQYRLDVMLEEMSLV